ncbi:MAG: hypothetical protein K2Y22_04335 [Candidatus Obscuribacterales bacterium]|nr:hypothetical protein [Candidatus Obscuribacterales bacterium]
MKKQLIALSVMMVAALPVMAVDNATVLTPGALYEITQKQAKAIGILAVRNYELEKRVEALEKKMTHAVNILKLQRENKASGAATK